MSNLIIAKGIEGLTADAHDQYDEIRAIRRAHATSQEIAEISLIHSENLCRKVNRLLAAMRGLVMEFEVRQSAADNGEDDDTSEAWGLAAEMLRAELNGDFVAIKDGALSQ